MANKNYKKISDVISILKDENGTSFLVNNEWVFNIPDDLSYEIDCECDWGFNFAIDLAEPIKPLVLTENEFKMSLEKHYSVMGDGYDVSDCKFDNRDGEDNFYKMIINDDENLYVDISLDKNVLFNIIQIRVRGSKLSPYDFTWIFGPSYYQDSEKHLGYMAKIAKSITRYNLKKDTVTKSNKSDTVFNDIIQMKSDGWYIKVPEGYEASNDLDINGESGTSESGKYDLIVAKPQKGKKVNFITPYDNQVVFVTLDSGKSGLENLSLDTHLAYNIARHNIDYISALELLDGMKIAKKTESLLVLYAVFIPGRIRSYQVLVITNTRWTRCQMIVGGSVKKAEKDSLVQEILETITFNESDGEEQELNEIEDQNDDYDIDDLGELQAYTGSEKEIVLPDGISVIGVLAFAFNNKVTSIIISEGVESIKSEAFCRCVNLNTVELPSSLRNISDGVFYNCYSLNTIELPSGLRKIGNGAFDGCMELTSISIPDGCEEIGIEAFKYCKKLKDIYVPDSVYEIGEDAFCTFNYDTVIHTVRGSVAEKFAKENDLKFDYDNAPLSDSDFSVNIQESSDGEAQKLSGCKGSIPKWIIDDYGTLTAYRSSEKDIILPDGISTIGDHAFANNKYITSAVISEGVEIIEDCAFWCCENLNSIELPSSIKKIGKSAFNGCEKLTSIMIPESCEEIGSEVFWECENLKDIYVPDSVYEIGEDAFYTLNDATVIHTVRDSVADKYAEKNDLKVDYESVPSGDTTSVNQPESFDSAVQETSEIKASNDDYNNDALKNEEKSEPKKKKTKNIVILVLVLVVAIIAIRAYAINLNTMRNPLDYVEEAYASED